MDNIENGDKLCQYACLKCKVVVQVYKFSVISRNLPSNLLSPGMSDNLIIFQHIAFTLMYMNISLHEIDGEMKRN